MTCEKITGASITQGAAARPQARQPFFCDPGLHELTGKNLKIVRFPGYREPLRHTAIPDGSRRSASESQVSESK